MKIISVAIQSPRKPSIVGNAIVQIEMEGFSLKVSDLRIIRNRAGVLWVAFPDHPIKRERGCDYLLTIEPDAVLAKHISDAVLAEFAKWQAGGER
jgi:hypothetical protein